MGYKKEVWVTFILAAALGLFFNWAAWVRFGLPVPELRPANCTGNQIRAGRQGAQDTAGRVFTDGRGAGICPGVDR